MKDMPPPHTSEKESTTPTDRLAGIAATLGYEEGGRQWYVYRIPHLAQHHATLVQQFQQAGMQVYLPTYATTSQVRGTTITRLLPKFLDYVFVLGTLPQVQQLSHTSALTPVYAHHEAGHVVTPATRWLTVPASQMHALMLVAQGYDDQVLFSTPADHQLDKGDRVLVVNGRFQGVQGTLLTRQGTSGGRVYLQLTSTLGALTVNIPEQDLQVLQFARSTNHLYYKMQAIERLLEQALQQHQRDGHLQPQVQTTLRFFLFRYARLQGLTHVNQAKITGYRYAALRLLHRDAEAATLLAQYHQATQHSKDSRRAQRRTPSIQHHLDIWVQRFPTT